MLFYRHGDDMMTVDVTAGPPISVGTPRRVFEKPYNRSDGFWPNYDVTPDGRRLLMVRSTSRDTPSRVNVVLNWLDQRGRVVSAELRTVKAAARTAESSPADTKHNVAMLDTRSLQRAPVDGGHLEYVLHGSGDPMLFIHGAGIADAFLPLMNRPPLAGLQQIHYRRRGYTSTAAGGPPENFMARAAADAAQLLAYLRVDAAHVVGHSSGALIALDRVPHASRRAVTGAARAAILGVASNGPHMSALTPAVERYAAEDRARAIDGLFSVVFGPGWRPHADLAVPGGAEQAESDAATFFESELPGVGAWQFDARRAAQVRQPVLFMMGSATVPFHKKAGERIREWWPSPSDTWLPAQVMLCRSSSLTTWRRNREFIARH